MTITSDYTELRDKQQKVWSSGDYNKIAALTVPVSEHLVDHVGVMPGSRVLDVATGTGHVALAAARRSAVATGIDYVPELLEIARRRAVAEDLEIEFTEADAENLPYGDASFDFVLSAIGVMFAADHARAARELVRVARPGGRIAVASWTPEGFVGGMLAAVGRHVSPPAGAQPATRWGVRGRRGRAPRRRGRRRAVGDRDGAPALRPRRRTTPTCSSPTTARRTPRQAGSTSRAGRRSAPTWSRWSAPSTRARAPAWSATGSTASSPRPVADGRPTPRTTGRGAGGLLDRRGHGAAGPQRVRSGGASAHTPDRRSSAPASLRGSTPTASEPSGDSVQTIAWPTSSLRRGSDIVSTPSCRVRAREAGLRQDGAVAYDEPRRRDRLLRCRAGEDVPEHLQVDLRLGATAHRTVGRDAAVGVLDDHRHQRVGRSLAGRRVVGRAGSAENIEPRLCRMTPVPGSRTCEPKEWNSDWISDTAVPSDDTAVTATVSPVAAGDSRGGARRARQEAVRRQQLVLAQQSGAEGRPAPRARHSSARAKSRDQGRDIEVGEAAEALARTEQREQQVALGVRRRRGHPHRPTSSPRSRAPPRPTGARAGPRG